MPRRQRRQKFTITRSGRILLGTYRQRKQRRMRQRVKRLRQTNRIASRLHGPRYRPRVKKSAELKSALRGSLFV